MKQERGIAHIILIALIALLTTSATFYYLKNQQIANKDSINSMETVDAQQQETANQTPFAELTLQASNPTNGYTTYKIPNTKLEVTIPSTFKKTDDQTAGLQAHATPVINLLKSSGTYATQSVGKETKYIFATIDERITIYVEETQLDPIGWLVENVTFQGQPFDPDTVSSVKETQINGRKVTMTYTSCCAGYTPTYIFEDSSPEGRHNLVILTTNAMLWGKETRADGNYLLDYLIAQIK